MGVVAWLTAIAGAAFLLLAHHLISGQSSSRRGWFAHRQQSCRNPS